MSVLKMAVSNSDVHIKFQYKKVHKSLFYFVNTFVCTPHFHCLLLLFFFKNIDVEPTGKSDLSEINLLAIICHMLPYLLLINAHISVLVFNNYYWPRYNL